MGLLGDLAKALNFIMGVLDEYLALLLDLYAPESLNVQYFAVGCRTLEAKKESECSR